MPDYRRYRVVGGTYFLTVNQLEKKPNDLPRSVTGYGNGLDGVFAPSAGFENGLNTRTFAAWLQGQKIAHGAMMAGKTLRTG
jgi:hypothetical protein